MKLCEMRLVVVESEPKTKQLNNSHRTITPTHFELAPLIINPDAFDRCISTMGNQSSLQVILQTLNMIESIDANKRMSQCRSAKTSNNYYIAQARFLSEF